MAVIARLLAPNSSFQTRFFFLAKRFVAGDTIESALAAVRALNADGLTATLDFLGEDVTELREAERTRDTYLEMLQAIESSRVRSNVSVKLTALGLRVDEERCTQMLGDIVARAQPLADPFVRIDMEGSAVTAATLRVFERTYAQSKNVGPVIQAYLKRSPGDVERAIALGARVRLCKGAYAEPETIAIGDMPAIRRAYLQMAQALLSRGKYPGIATHDERLIDALKTYTADRKIDKERFEFQMLYGLRPAVQRRLVREGYNVRVYVPFGTHWAGYFYRRITERKENAFFALRSLIAR
ncbi:MAG: proline dehydrogenase family protein [Candidatus Eremiobacteraeota bacterium]|nr:proline dehydrogenase family protein [Candidatus Eremiobacteraeota bacterium]MBC5801478.1 proline dehydrogenase family protein [Candidatus Eremiobacteraeota bacterium]MBC5820922.1 proline dehydrogenase family protein [Candidatus Eremiobacteraeota bacterium]